MLDLARATAGDKMPLLHHLQTKTAAGGTYLMYSDISNYCRVGSAYSATSMHIAIPQASNWAPDTSMGEVCKPVLFIFLATVVVLASYKASNTTTTEKTKGSDLLHSLHANAFCVLCLRWWGSSCLLNLGQSISWWLTTARRNFYQPALVCSYHDCALLEA